MSETTSTLPDTETGSTLPDTGTTAARIAAGEDAGALAQSAAEHHLAAIYAAEEAAEETEDDDVEIESPAVGPWCGCETCVIREVLHAAWPVFEAEAIARLRAAGFDAAADFLIGEAAEH